MKRLFIALVFSVGSVHAATISFSSLVGSGVQADEWIVTNSSGVALSSGTVSVGYFNTISGTNGQLGAMSYATLVADFHALTVDDFVTYSSSINSPNGPIAGVTGGDVNIGAYSGSSRQLYVMISNTAALDGSATQYAFLNSNQTLTADGGTPDSNDFFFKDATVIAGTVGVGSFNGANVTGNNPQAATTLQLVAVPEPSAALLGGLGALALLRRRRVA